MSEVHPAILRLQDIVQACTTVVFKSAPDYPTENVEPFPCSVAYIGSGRFWFTNRTVHHNVPVIILELHFSRTNLKQSSYQIDAIAIELPKRLAYDPTLDGTVETIVSTPDEPVSYIRRPYLWQPQATGQQQVVSEMLRFEIPVKMLQSPQATA